MTIDAAFAHFPSLSTNRLLLRQIQPEDAEALFATFSDEETMRFYGHELHRSLEETRQSIEQTQARYATLKGEDRVIGSCSLLGAFLKISYFRKIFSIAFPFANSSINLSR